MNEKDRVAVDKEEYEELVSDQKFLRALEAAGVDGWDGYEVAQENMEE